ncbi:MAG: hypothetical protein F4W90_02230 [Gammaproteobacteria bacterium]|nr:hypothetical protein [Gammaproteobacteria bacterium]
MPKFTVEDKEWLNHAESLHEIIRAHAAKAEEQRHLPNSVAVAMAKNGLYRLGAPLAIDGADAKPIVQMAVIEAISRADGSTGWNLMIGIETFALVGPSMATCAEMIADPLTIMASSTAAVGEAVPCEGGWLINGQWQFASGVHNAGVFGATVRKIGVANEPAEKRYYAILPKGKFEIVDTWNVSGLRGSGSHDVRIENQIVANSHLVATLGHGSMPSKQLAIPLNVRLTFNKIAVALGIARAAIDSFIELAHGKVPRFANKKLKDRPFAQRQLAKAEARLRTNRAAVYEHTEHVTDICFSGNKLNDEDIAVAHLLASEATTGCVYVVESLLEASGTTANYLGHPLEKIARDIRVIRQHTTVSPQHIDHIGQALIGNGLNGFLRGV